MSAVSLQNNMLHPGSAPYPDRDCSEHACSPPRRTALEDDTSELDMPIAQKIQTVRDLSPHATLHPR